MWHRAPLRIESPHRWAEVHTCAGGSLRGLSLPVISFAHFFTCTSSCIFCVVFLSGMSGGVDLGEKSSKETLHVARRCIFTSLLCLGALPLGLYTMQQRRWRLLHTSSMHTSACNPMVCFTFALAASLAASSEGSPCELKATSARARASKHRGTVARRRTRASTAIPRGYTEYSPLGQAVTQNSRGCFHKWKQALQSRASERKAELSMEKVAASQAR